MRSSGTINDVTVSGADLTDVSCIIDATTGLLMKQCCNQRLPPKPVIWVFVPDLIRDRLWLS